jgi:hypothetical protein
MHKQKEVAMTFDPWFEQPGKIWWIDEKHPQKDFCRQAWDAAIAETKKLAENKEYQRIQRLKEDALLKSLNHHKYTMEEKKMNECLSCKSFNGKIDGCVLCNNKSGVGSALDERTERCPWPSKRVEKRTKIQLFMDAVYQMPMMRDPEGEIKAHLISCLRHAGYEPEEK